MVSILEAIILGIVQGITEWVPISSSGHLVLFETLFGVQQPIIFDAVLHLGSLVAVLFVFWKDIMRLIRGFFRWEKFYVRYVLWLAIASVPIAVVGLLFNTQIKAAFHNLTVVGISFLFTALVLFLSRFARSSGRKLGWRSVIMMGIMQAFALLPGVSRSGMTIATGLRHGVKQQDVARFSFLLFIPAVVGATVLEIGSIGEVTNVVALGVGTLVTVIVGIITLQLLLNIIKNQKFHYFGWYCLVLGIIVLVL